MSRHCLQVLSNRRPPCLYCVTATLAVTYRVRFLAILPSLEYSGQYNVSRCGVLTQKGISPCRPMLGQKTVYLRIQATVVSNQHLFVLLRNDHFFFVVVMNYYFPTYKFFICVVGYRICNHGLLNTSWITRLCPG